MIKAFFYNYFVIGLFLFSINSFAQLDSLVYNNHYRKHLTLLDTFSGDEDLYQVCYPKDHKPMFYFIIIFSITTLVLGIMVIKLKTKSNKKLKEKNSIIENQNKDFIDSVNYALRIQQAILPDTQTIDALLDNGFVLYKPKHIVSGDFYWIHDIGDIIYIAVIDCTGHGVPGALLTILGHNAINKAIVEKGLKEPTEILDSMNNDVKNVLKQNQHNTIQDGMEVGLVCYNVITNHIQFSGANLSLTCIINSEVKILDSGKCSVGSVQSENIKLPVTQNIQLNKGDSLYLYTDGYADQFGGPKGKKYKYKQLEELLKNNSAKSSLEQKDILETNFNMWKGNLEQVDDVTVIGITIK